MTDTAQPLLQPPGVLRILSNLLCPASRQRHAPTRRRDRDDATRAALLDLMQCHPEGFQSELDLLNLNHWYPSRF
ncbi:hypothetical protein LCL97_22545 [Seohaeicola saemankumensis]|nr:hypothetical protein [Seohaeicola saemankumensis]MCA0873622.1 hypothetical protein [Seohaeicola saemankumensis]